MKKIFNSTLATMFAATCLAGASVAFAADNGNNGNNGNNNNNNNTNTAGHKNKDNKCADDNNATNSGANCTTEPNAEQQ